MQEFDQELELSLEFLAQCLAKNLDGARQSIGELSVLNPTLAQRVEPMFDRFTANPDSLDLLGEMRDTLLDR